MVNKKFLIPTVILLVIAIASCIFIYNQNTKKQEYHAFPNVPIRTEAELISGADLIITGEVKELLPSKWSNPDLQEGKRNILQTDIVVNITNILKGDRTEKTVTVRIDKGEDEKNIVYSDGYPDFIVREKVLLFLSKDDSDVATNEDYYVLTGMLYGKYNLDKNSGKYINDKYSFEIAELKNRLLKESGEN